MTGMRFTSNVSLGNVLQAILLVIATVAAFATLRESVLHNEASLQEEVTRGIARDVRLRALETTVTRSDERYNSIMALLTRMDKTLERLEKRE